MKIWKYIIGVLAFTGAITSCDKDNIGGIYTPYAQNVSFESDEAINTKTSDNSLEFSVRLIRNIKQGEYTAHYTLTSEDEGIFSDANNGTVTFADGQSVAYISIKTNNMVKGEEYAAQLKLSEADVATLDTIIGAPIVETSLIVMCDYDWVAVGKGFYSSPEWWEEEYDVDIEKAEGTNLYRIKDLFAEGYDIQFTIGADNVVTVLPQESWKHSTYGVVYLEGFQNEDKSYVAGTYDPATKKVDLTFRHYVSAGTFGVFVDTLTMP